MAGTLKKFQKKGFINWKGMTKENHLGGIFQKYPQKASNLMVQLLAYYRGKSLDTFLSQFPTKEFETSDEYTWDVAGSSRRNVALVEARDEFGNIVGPSSANVGANTAPFQLVFAEDWFADQEVIVGNLNEAYQFRVLGEGRAEGTNTVYDVELMGGNIDGVPAERLLAGERFSVETAYVEQELSRKAGDVRFSSPIEMRNEFSTVRIYHKVTGKMLNKKLAIGIPVMKENEAGKLTKSVETMWMHYVEWQVEEQFSDYKNNAIAFGRSNRNPNGEYKNIGKSGGVIKTGDGLFAQMESGNTHYYGVFSLKLIEDALYELSAGKLGLNDRVFVMKTGERGAIQFHKAIMKEASGWTMWSYNGDQLGVINKVNSPLHAQALGAGFQFVEYRSANNVTLRIEVENFYDDPVRNKIQHPLGGPAMSYRYDIMSLGTAEEPNIFKCTVKDSPEIRGYRSGFRNPFTGETNIQHMSYDEDSAEIHRMATLGVCVLDPTRTMSLIPNILMG